MHTHLPRPRLLVRCLLLCIALVGAMLLPPSGTPSLAPTASRPYIVQSATAELAAQAVQQAGGVVTTRLEIIHGVTASLDGAAAARLRAMAQIRLHADTAVRSSGVSAQETITSGFRLYPAAATGAHLLHEQQVPTRKSECKERRVTTQNELETRPLQGRGVTVAVIDTGFMRMESPGDWTHRDAATGTLIAENSGRCIVYRDFIGGAPSATNSVDPHGHGTHVAATIADAREAPMAANLNATPVGVAPEVNLLVARALGADGSGTYTDVIAAIQWVIENQQRYNVRVLNLSLYAPATGPYWADPLNQAVMRAWQAGIVVVVAAGNDGPAAGTIGVPGNVPYVVTVGALTSGRHTQSGTDQLASYSSRGPTESAFVKPDVVVPATRTIAALPSDSTLARNISSGRVVETASLTYGIGAPAEAHTYFQLSGTSMAAAQVSGVVALMLQATPDLTNDQVKFRLMATARPAVDQATGLPAYSVWEQGAGLIHTRAAIFDPSRERANSGMDIGLDLNPTQPIHYWGFTTWNPTTQQFQLIDPSTGRPLSVWDVGRRADAGTFALWAGGRRADAGSFSILAGGRRADAGANHLWAGGQPGWVQSVNGAGGTARPQAVRTFE